MSKLVNTLNESESDSFLGLGKKAKAKRAAKKAAVKPAAASPDFVQVLKPLDNTTPLQTIAPTPTPTPLPETITSPVYVNALGNTTGGTGSLGELYKGDTSENLQDVAVVGVRRKKKKDNTLIYIIAGVAVLIIVVAMMKKKK